MLSSHAFSEEYICSIIFRAQTKFRIVAKKDIEIQPGFEPGSSEFWSDALTN